MQTLTKHTLLLCLLALYLHGCSLIKPKTEVASSAEASVLHDRHMVITKHIQQFSLKGRLGVTTDPKSFSGRIAWQHAAEDDNIDIFSPLGGKVANIVSNNNEVTLTNSKGKQISAPDAETLTEEMLGFRLPLSGLSYWALGRPSNTGLVEYVTWDNEGRIINLKQNGWDIQYKDYNMHDGYFLPRKVTLRTDDLIIKLIAEKWSDIQSH